MTQAARVQGAGRIAYFAARAVALLLLIAAYPVGASLQFDVFLGFDGGVREAAWFPVVCELRNSGPPISGYIEVSSGGSKQQSQLVPIELPTGTLKRITIPVFAYNRYGGRWDVRLLNDRRKVIDEKSGLSPSRLVGWNGRLMGSLSRTASGAPVFKPILRQQSDAQPATARIQSDIFPDNPLVLEALDAVYLNSEVATRLATPQVEALLAWLNAGGHLIVGVEQVSDVTALGWLRGVLPVELKGTDSVTDHSQIHEWIRRGSYLQNVPNRPVVSTRSGVTSQQPFLDLGPDSRFELADLAIVSANVKEGRVLVASGEKPLMVTGNRGLGRVTALLFSPEREPVRSWKHLDAFWSALGEVPGELYASTDHTAGYGHNADAVFGAMLDSRQVHKLPKGWLFALLVVYLVVIGPFDQWWLKRIRRPMLTWITFPCYVVIFSGMIYVIGYKLRAGDNESNELHVVDVLPNRDRTELRGRTYATIYSPGNATFPMKSKEKPATLRGECLGSGGGMATEEFACVMEGDTFHADVFVPVWTSQLFISDWWKSDSAPVTLTVKRSSGGWAVTVRNAGTKAVTEAMLVVGDRAVPVTALSPGETRTFTVNSSAGQPLADFVRNIAGNFAGIVASRQQAFGDSERGTINNLPSAAMAASFLTLLGDPASYNSFVVSPGLDLTRPVMQGRAILMAWMPDFAPATKLNQVNAKRSFQHTFWRVVAPVEEP